MACFLLSPLQIIHWWSNYSTLNNIANLQSSLKWARILKKKSCSRAVPHMTVYYFLWTSVGRGCGTTWTVITEKRIRRVCGYFTVLGTPRVFCRSHANWKATHGAVYSGTSALLLIHHLHGSARLRNYQRKCNVIFYTVLFVRVMKNNLVHSLSSVYFVNQSPGWLTK